jgi:hypothetical protein
MAAIEAPAAVVPGSVPGAATTPAPPTGTEGEEPKVPPVEGQSVTTETPSPADGEVIDAEPEVNLDEVPENSGDWSKFKEVFKNNPDLAPELKQIIGREKAFSEMAPNGSFTEMREILTIIPTVADAEQLVADSDSKRELGRTFREDPTTFVESLKNSDPLAFQQFANELPKVLAETDPAMYSSQARTYSNAVLTNLAQIAHQEGNQDLLAAIHVVAQKLGARLGAEPTPQRDNSEAARLRKQLDERNQADAEAKFSSFWDQTDRVIIDQSVSAIETSIKKALPSATEAQLHRMVNEAYSKTLELLNSQPQTMAQVNAFRDGARHGKQGIAEHKAIVSYITGRTNLVIPKAVKGVIDEWSGQVLKLNTENIQKKTALAAKTRDVGTGPGATTSAAAPTNAGRGKLHAKDIFAKLADGSYVPPAQRH